MIRYQLRCEHDHEFEAWFKDSATYEDQVAMGEIQCPFCGNIRIQKAVMAPAVASRKVAQTQARQQHAIAAAEQAASDMRDGADPRLVAEQFLEAVSRVHAHLEETCDYVGENFADEARAIHCGDAEERGIYGEATPEETEELLDEGIEVLSLPKLGDKDKAN